jgi:hypothetical protein
MGTDVDNLQDELGPGHVAVAGLGAPGLGRFWVSETDASWIGHAKGCGSADG